MRRIRKLTLLLKAWLYEALGVTCGVAGPLRCGTRTNAMNGHKR
jgi:hypothetical protein